MYWLLLILRKRQTSNYFNNIPNNHVEDFFSLARKKTETLIKDNAMMRHISYVFMKNKEHCERDNHQCV